MSQGGGLGAREGKFIPGEGEGTPGANSAFIGFTSTLSGRMISSHRTVRLSPAQRTSLFSASEQIG